ncbi:MAG: glycine oxidase ThiO [Ignavibacteriae bacterium]|nr:glycine oxidase ThiO [Ignavibacteriota bacterium]MCB9217384.1 glycine oxidase ThiO [Ignavibacteria bacterium]
MIGTDVCIVGGGIAGLTLARALTLRGGTVCVVDRGKIGGGTSSVAAGMLAPMVEARLQEREVVEFGCEALRFWREFAGMIEREAEMEIDYRQEGTLVVAVERDHIGIINHLHDEQRELGLPVESLSGYECRKLESYLSPTVSEGFFSTSDHQVDNRLLLRGLRRICEVQGVRIVEDAGEVTLEQGVGGWIVTAENESISARRVVVATGASLAIFRSLQPKLARLIRPVKGQILRLDQSEMPLLQHVVRTPDVYFAPKSDGTLIVGASSEDRGFDSAVRLGPLYETLQAAWETIPALYELPVVESAVGFRPASLDHAPLLGETSLEGVYLATGYYRHGILFAPLAAELIAEEILEEKRDERIRAFNPARFDQMYAERQGD